MSENAGENKTTIDFSSLVGGILSSPDALAKITDIISKLGADTNSNNSPPSTPIDENTSNTPQDLNQISTIPESSSPTFQNSDINSIISKMPDFLSKLSSVKSENSIADKQQIALLLAIRPYLSERRKELIDTFIKMNHLGAIFKNLT